MSSTELPEDESRPTPNDVLIDRHGWRQGSLLPDDLRPKILASPTLRNGVNAQDVLIVISHDCDVVSPNFESERFVDVLVARRVTRPDGNFSYGKNHRRLHFFLPLNGALLSLECFISDVVHLDRNLLSTSPPAGAIDSKNLHTIRHWISSRYVRASFPTAFNTRLKDRERQIRAALEKATNEIAAVHIVLDTYEELPAGAHYKVFITATMVTEKYEEKKYRAEAEKAILKFSAELAKCADIRIGDDPKVVPENLFSLDDARNSRRWDCDSMSIKDGGDMPT